MSVRRFVIIDIIGLLVAGLAWGVVHYAHRQASAEVADEVTRGLLGDLPAGVEPATGPATVSTRLGLKTGDCLVDPDDVQPAGPDAPSGVRSVVPTVPCADRHGYEVTSVLLMAGGPYPGQSFLRSVGEPGCENTVVGYAGADRAEKLRATAIWPSRSSWDDLDDRAITCLVADADRRTTTGSVGLS